MEYNEVNPDPALANLITCYWYFVNAGGEEKKYTILPDGRFDLIVILRKGTLEDVFITGLWTKQIEVDIAPETELFGVRFTPLAAEYLVRKRLAPFLNDRLPLALESWGINSLGFDNHKRVKEQWDELFLSILSTSKKLDKRKVKLFTLLFRTHGTKSVEDYANLVGWTSRQMHRYFHNRFGISLKTYCNVLKCYRSFAHIKEGNLYPELDYFDQSHFIKEIRKHTGSSPRELYKNENDRFLQLTTHKVK